jgi:hypothetical protein
MDAIPFLKTAAGIGLGALILAGFILQSPGCTGESSSKFDGENAFGYLVKQCGFGPRVPGTDQHRLMEEWLLGLLKAYSDTVETDAFSVDEEGGDLPEFRNYIARFNREATQRVLVCAHYDTRPVADRDPDPGKRGEPIAGANDGASGVAVLLELARIFSLHRPKVGVDLVFFDGEDYGKDMDSMFFGSRRFASKNRAYRPLFGILLDMVGDRDLQIYQELYSLNRSPETVKRFWDLARDMGLGDIFVPVGRQAILDDHVPLLQAGIRCIDVIDFDYPYWHTTEDTPDKCEGESLRAVGSVVLRAIEEVSP